MLSLVPAAMPMTCTPRRFNNAVSLRAVRWSEALPSVMMMATLGTPFLFFLGRPNTWQIYIKNIFLIKCTLVRVKTSKVPQRVPPVVAIEFPPRFRDFDERSFQKVETQGNVTLKEEALPKAAGSVTSPN